MTTTHAIRLGPMSKAILSGLLVTGLFAAVQLRSTARAVGDVVPKCVDSQLAVSDVAAAGGSLHAGLIIHYRNVSETACELTGYADVVGVNFDTGKSRAAGRIRDGYLGGWAGHKNGKPKPPPVVILHSRSGEASSMVEWADGATAQQPGCAVLTSLWVNMRGGSRPVALAAWMLVCGYFDATPFVPGTTGSGH